MKILRDLFESKKTRAKRLAAEAEARRIAALREARRREEENAAATGLVVEYYRRWHQVETPCVTPEEIMQAKYVQTHCWPCAKSESELIASRAQNWRDFVYKRVLFCQVNRKL